MGWPSARSVNHGEHANFPATHPVRHDVLRACDHEFARSFDAAKSPQLGEVGKLLNGAHHRFVLALGRRQVLSRDEVEGQIELLGCLLHPDD